MKRLSWFLLQSVVPFGIALAPTAQGQVWVVDDTPGTGADFASIQTAIDAGAVVDGDVLLVKPGNYAFLSITNGKALTIQADSGGTVTVLRGFVSGLPSGKCVRLRGLSMNPVTLSSCAGTIWVEECTITAEPAEDGLTVSSCADVILIRSSIAGGNGFACDFSLSGSGNGLCVSGASSVTSYGCRFQGGQGGSTDLFITDPCVGSAGGDGVRSNDSRAKLFFSDCEARGGLSGPAGENRLGCHIPSGGSGLRVSVGSAVILDSTFVGGPGLPSPCTFLCGFCEAQDGLPGVPILGTPQFLPGKALRATISSPVRENESLAIHIEGPPHVPVWLASSTAPRSSRRIELLRGISLLEPQGVHGLVFLGITNAAGNIDKSIPAGTLPAGLESSLSFWQLVYMESPVLPGGFKVLRYPEEAKAFVLGQGSMIVELDESF